MLTTAASSSLFSLELLPRLEHQSDHARLVVGPTTPAKFATSSLSSVSASLFSFEFELDVESFELVSVAFTQFEIAFPFAVFLQNQNYKNRVLGHYTNCISTTA